MYQFQTALNQNTFLSLKILEALMQKDLTDEDRAKIIAEGFAEFENRYPNLQNVSTKTDLSETELRLIREIQDIKLDIKGLDNKTSKEIKELDNKLSKEIKELDNKLSKEMKELDNKLSKEMKELDLRISDVKFELSKEIKELDNKLSKEIQESKNSTIKWVAGLMFAQVVTFGGLFFTAFKIFMPIQG